MVGIINGIGIGHKKSSLVLLFKIHN